VAAAGLPGHLGMGCDQGYTSPNIPTNKSNLVCMPARAPAIGHTLGWELASKYGWLWRGRVLPGIWGNRRFHGGQHPPKGGVCDGGCLSCSGNGTTSQMRLETTARVSLSW